MITNMCNKFCLLSRPSSKVMIETGLASLGYLWPFVQTIVDLLVENPGECDESVPFSHFCFNSIHIDVNTLLLR